MVLKATPSCPEKPPENPVEKLPECLGEKLHEYLVEKLALATFLLIPDFRPDFHAVFRQGIRAVFRHDFRVVFRGHFGSLLGLIFGPLFKRILDSIPNNFSISLSRQVVAQFFGQGNLSRSVQSDFCKVSSGLFYHTEMGPD